MNFVEIVKSVFQPYLDDEKPPLHVGEAYHLWYYKNGIEQTLRNAEVGYNTVEDTELKDKIKDLIDNVLTPMRKEVEEFLKDEHVPLPIVSPEKAVSEYSNTPKDAKLSDEEIANQLSWAILMGIQIGVRGLTESVRADVGALFAKYQMLQMVWGLTMKQLMVKRGWLRVPPNFQV
ncbi:DUF3231 family protein [Marinicrinis lubricantis]|uniref:DUF3231 family protein n=1 Tax=Marinicrinis lubricantis TaxID=2086470 RepID=A0ABW1IMU1_9BACL